MPKIQIGTSYLLRQDPKLGDYSGTIVDVEAGPRQPNNQYRVSWGKGNYDVDWINSEFFAGARPVTLTKQVARKLLAQKEVYHVTFTKYLPRIMKKGILPLQTSNWVKSGNPEERYGNGEIYSFEHMDDAIRWAAKMDWEFNKSIGTGKISILTVQDPGGWEVDEADPLSQAGAKGNWLKKHGLIPPDAIVSSIPLTSELVKTITQR